jgi:hypothetical protein
VCFFAAQGKRKSVNAVPDGGTRFDRLIEGPAPFAKNAIATGQSPIFDLSELVTSQGLRSVSADQGASFVSGAKRYKNAT